MKTTWNTGRPYAKVGQQLAAEMVGDTIIFVDATRMLDGEFEEFIPTVSNERQLQEAVMWVYDRSQYKPIRPEWGDKKAALLKAALAAEQIKKEQSV